MCRWDLIRAFVHELFEEAQASKRAKVLTSQIITHPPTTNVAIVTGISRINALSMTDDLFPEGLLAAAVQTNPDRQERLEAFFPRSPKWLEP